jgi:hypothetical protein
MESSLTAGQVLSPLGFSHTEATYTAETSVIDSKMLTETSGITHTSTSLSWSYYPAGIQHYDSPKQAIDMTSAEIYTETKFDAFTIPETNRQPEFTANPTYVLLEKGRKNWWDFFKTPVFVSIKGSTAPVSLHNLDTPSTATWVRDKEVDIMDLGSSIPVLYGVTKTLSFMTTLTAKPGDVVYLAFPTPTGPPISSMTTLSVQPTDLSSKQFPNGMPILFLTQVEGVVLDSLSHTLTTITQIQTPPAPWVSPDGKVALAVPHNDWGTWSDAGKIGVAVAAVLAGLITIAALIYFCATTRKREKENAEINKRQKTSRGLKEKVHNKLHSALRRNKDTGKQRVVDEEMAEGVNADRGILARDAGKDGTAKGPLSPLSRENVSPSCLKKTFSIYLTFPDRKVTEGNWW